MQKGTLFWITAFALLSSCSRLDIRPDCNDQSSRPRDFDYTSLTCGPQVTKYFLYSLSVNYRTESSSSIYLGGDSTFFKIPDDYMPKADSTKRETAFMDSIRALINIYDISARNWGPSPGQEPRHETFWILCVQFADNETDVPISKALAPVSSSSEAFLIAEKELPDYWIIESSEQLGQGIDSTEGGYAMKLLHFERMCPNQCLGMIDVFCHENGALDLTRNVGAVRTFTCRCGPDALP